MSKIWGCRGMASKCSLAAIWARTPTWQRMAMVQAWPMGPVIAMPACAVKGFEQGESRRHICVQSSPRLLIRTKAVDCKCSLGRATVRATAQSRPSGPGGPREVTGCLKRVIMLRLGRARQVLGGGELVYQVQVRPAWSSRQARAVVRTGREASYFHRSNFEPPPGAGTMPASRLARDQSSCSAPARVSNSFWCSRSQTPAACQSRNRRQQVIPLPQPISCGSISQGMPVCRTNRIPAKAARFEMRGLPPFGFSGSSGSRGSTICQSSSLTSCFAMPQSYQDLGFC